LKTDFFAAFRQQPLPKACDQCGGCDENKNPSETKGFPLDGVVTEPEQRFVTSVTDHPTCTGGHNVTKPPVSGVTSPEPENTKQNQENFETVTPSQRSQGRTDPPARNVVPDSRHPLISDAVRAKIEAIEAEARAKGWPAELLWNGGFWDRPRSLAAVLDAGDEIVEVNADGIKILKLRRDVQTFRRNAA